MKRRFVLKSFILAWPLLVSCSSSADDSKSDPVEEKTETRAESEAVVVAETVAQPAPKQPVEQPAGQPAEKAEEAGVTPAHPKEFSLVLPDQAWSKQKIADCKFETRSGRMIRDRLLREVQSCGSLDALKAAVDGYFPVLVEGDVETEKSLQSCSRPVATAEFMNRFNDTFVRCRTENLSVDKKTNLFDQVKKVYQMCQTFSVSPLEISSNISHVDISSMYLESESLPKPLTTLSTNPETLDLFLRRTTLLSSFFKGEAKTVCSLAINDLINGQGERFFHE